MMVVPAGSFMMGAPATEILTAWYKIRIPQHYVMIAQPFAVSKYELSFADWDACVAGGGCNGYRPNDQGWGRGQQQAVMNVDWDDAQQYVAWLSQVTGKTYRLLSEAEYEYAARAGTTTAYPWGDDITLNGMTMAACNGCGSDLDNGQAAPIGRFPPNKFGLYDMVGNTWEWTEDSVHPNYEGAPLDGSAWVAGGDYANRIVRGGAWDSTPDLLRSSNRYMGASNSRSNDFGFRVARTLISIPGSSTTDTPSTPGTILAPSTPSSPNTLLRSGGGSSITNTSPAPDTPPSPNALTPSGGG
jgi:formylglycine-generating enzyme required for sulfatase activity